MKKLTKKQNEKILNVLENEKSITEVGYKDTLFYRVDWKGITYDVARSDNNGEMEYEVWICSSGKNVSDKTKLYEEICDYVAECG
jgi:hypothetical protein